jgi:hypothetical protein
MGKTSLQLKPSQTLGGSRNVPANPGEIKTTSLECTSVNYIIIKRAFKQKLFDHLIRTPLY